MTARRNIEEFKQIAINKGGKCLSDHYINNHTHLKWECKFGHIWNASSKGIKKGTWCPVCYNQTENRRKVKHQPHKLKDVQNKAKENGGICLSTEYINNSSLMRFRCAENHEWETTWKSINSGAWCPYCCKFIATPVDKKRIQDEAQQIAKLRGGKLLSKYVKNKEKLKWECSLGHTWKATYSNVIKNNSWCPKCSANLSERICRYALEELFGLPFLKVRPSWLRNSRGNLMELDGYNEEIGLAFEHNGAQHYRITKGFIDNQEELDKRREDDVLKEKLCDENGIKLLIIPELFNKVLPKDLKYYLIDKLKTLGIKAPFESKTIDINFFYNKDLELQNNLEEIKNKAINKNGKCLSDVYISCNSPLNFVCEFGHCWTTTATNIRNGAWCHTCANKTSKTIKDAQDLATKRGGFCLSKEYINSQTPMTWQCGDCDHIWETSYNLVQSGRWCPPCGIKRRAKKKMISINAYKEIARKKRR